MKEFPDCFPENFETEILPEDAREDNKDVYRVIKNGILDRESFISTYEEIQRGLIPPKKSYFENVTEIGNLYLEYVFYEFEQEPVLFLCRDEYANIYLCLCIDIRYEQSWVIVPCNIALLHLLIEEKMDIASVFLSRKKGWKIIMDICGNEKSESVQMKDIDRLDLPKEGTYIRCDKEKAEMYLWKRAFEEEMKRNYDVVNESDMSINSLEAA